MWQKTLTSSEQMKQFGRKLSQLLQAGDVVVLDGDLGAGKTTLCQGIIQGLGVDEMVSSPTFTLVQSYQGQVSEIHHFDVYRINHPAELEQIGFDEYLSSNAIVLIEWGQQITAYLPHSYYQIEIEYIHQDKRKLSFSKIGQALSQEKRERIDVCFSNGY